MNKIDFILLFDALDANPNGDPDSGNMPRLDVETNMGLVTDVCLKRKIRNYVALTRGNMPPYEIYVKEKAILEKQHERAYLALGLDPKKAEPEQTKEWMCQNFYDIRTFGAVMSLKINCGQVRGPVQLSFGRSVSPITQMDHTLTRCAVATEKESIKQEGGNKTMGMKTTIPYGLYMVKGTINPYLAEQTGFGGEDLSLLKEALVNLFEFDASAARPAGSMTMRRIIFFNHDKELGSAPAHKLYEALDVKLKPGVEFPRSIKDYEIELQTAALPEGVSVEELI